MWMTLLLLKKTGSKQVNAPQPKILNFGSLNIDYVYQVKHFARPGETLCAQRFSRFPGGKGLNQSLATARAGGNVRHAGRIGTDGLFLKELLEQNSCDVSTIETDMNNPTGHAVIQVDESGENSIVLFGGANRTISTDFIAKAMAGMVKNDYLLMQNEISSPLEIIELAYNKGLKIFINPAPMTDDVKKWPLDKIDTLILNETECAMLADDNGKANLHPLEALEILRHRHPESRLIQPQICPEMLGLRDFSNFSQKTVSFYLLLLVCVLYYIRTLMKGCSAWEKNFLEKVTPEFAGKSVQTAIFMSMNG